jgi:LytS/YehU family sensor histidine kinase
VLLALISLFTIPFATATLWGWRVVTGDTGTRQYALPTALFAVVALVVAITHVYETVFLLRDWESDRLRSARMEQARLQTELESLGREVDPHFLFNNLNALTHLIEQRSEAAPGFIRTLSATYQYVLDCRDRTLVPLAAELEALERHRSLAAIRYGGDVRLDVQVPSTDADRLLLPPVSLAELFQNALKHNTVAGDRPLQIQVRVEDETLVVENTLRPGPNEPRSTRVGLTNMADRFRIATNRVMQWGIERDRFIVRLPLVNSATRDTNTAEPHQGG